MREHPPGTAVFVLVCVCICALIVAGAWAIASTVGG